MDAIDGLAVRPLLAADLEQAVALSAAVGWNQVEADWRVFLELGRPVAVLDHEGRLAATAATLPGERFAWISMVIVRADHRRRGIATELLRRCAAEIAAAGLVAGLDATPAGREVYLRLGFRDSFALTRWRRAGTAREPASACVRPGVRVRPAGALDLEAIARLEQTASGANRSRLLARLLDRSTGFAAVAETDREPCGFLLGRDGRTATHLGPLVAENDDVAQALCAQAVARIDTPVTIDAADRFTGFARWLEAGGFARERPFTRMYRGRSEPLGDPRLSVAIAGPELG